MLVAPNQTFPFGTWDLDWVVVFGGGPNPYVSIAQTYSQATDLQLFSSIRGSYDYRFQTDFTVATPSAIVTDFEWPLNTGTFPLPFTWPTDSVPTTN